MGFPRLGWHTAPGHRLGFQAANYGRPARRRAGGSKRNRELVDRMLDKTFMNIRKLDHVSFLVKDVERSRRFYGQVLGLREIPRTSSANNLGAWLTTDEQ